MSEHQNMKNPWQTLTTKTVYDNPWIKVEHHEVLNPSGNAGIYGKVCFKNVAVGVIPLDENLNTWIVGQYRYTLNRYSWEIPEGGSPFGEDPLQTARRELKEETGIEAKKWKMFLEMDVSNSVTDEVALLYVAQDLTFGKAEPEDSEDLKVRKLSFDELVDMVMKGKVTDSLSVAAVLKLKLLLDVKGYDLFKKNGA